MQKLKLSDTNQYRKYHEGRCPDGHLKQSTQKIVERRLTTKHQHRTKSQYGGPESIADKGSFILNNVKDTATIYSDQSGLGRSNFLNNKFDVGTTNHSKGEWVNPKDYDREAFSQSHDQNAENAHKRSRIQKLLRNGPGMRNIFPTEDTHRQKWLFFEDWSACFTNRSPEDMVVTWLQHLSLVYRKKTICRD